MTKMCVEMNRSTPRPTGDFLSETTRQVAHYARCVLEVTGVEPRYAGYTGDFAWKLTDLALKCDAENLDLLARGFPEVVTAVQLWRTYPAHAARIAEDWS